MKSTNTAPQISSFFSPKVIKKRSAISQNGLFASDYIRKDEVIAVKGGHIVDEATFSLLPDSCKKAALQLYDFMFLVPFTQDEIEDVMIYINHSCEPNVGLRGHILTVAMRDIAPGEELVGDYCMAYSNEYFNLKCNCATKSCRIYISADDWKRKDLQTKYKGYFSQYINDKIAQQKSA